MDFKKRTSALHKIALIVLAAACPQGFAIGLGAIQIQSALNQPLHVSIPILGTDFTDIKELCPKGRVETFDAALLARPQFSVSSGAQSAALIITTSQAINEPAVALNIDIGCGTSVRRHYQILLDPVTTLPASKNVQTVRQAEPLADLSMNPGQSSAPAASTSATSVASPSTVAAAVRKSKDANAQEAKTPTVKKGLKNKVVPADQDAGVRPKAVDRKSGLSTQLNAKKVSRNVLRLSADVSPVENVNMLNGMKLSDSITVEGLETDPQKTAELRAAQMRFAAIIRGEDPEKNAETEAKAAQDRIQALLKESDQIRLHSEQGRLAFEEDQKKSLHINWFIGLGTLLLACVIAVAWLARRLYQVNKMNQRPFWDHYYSADEADPENHDAHEDSPFSDTVTEFEDTSSLQDDDVAIVSAAAPHSEDQAAFGKPADGSKDVSKALSTGSLAAEKAGKHAVEKSVEILPMQQPDAAHRNRKRAEMIEVEEISDAMEEAEFWMSLRDPQRALSVLEHFNDVDQPKSPMAWLYLLKLYREVDDRPRFDALLERFKSHFNTKAPEWDVGLDEASGKGLEDYPHLITQICRLWGNDLVARYLEDLMFNNRKGQREGFDLSVYLDLIMLANIAYEVLPQNRAAKPATINHV